MSVKRIIRPQRLFAAMLAVVITGTAFAATEKPYDEIDEIWVQGERLSKSIVDVEDDFFKLYNKVNKKRDYDIYCGYMSLHRGSMIMTRTCMPAFVTYNTPAYTGFYRTYSTTTSNSVDGYSSMVMTPVVPYTPPSGLLLMERRADYAQNVLDVINSDERLLEKYMHLIGMYEELRQTQGRYVSAQEAAGVDASRRASTYRSKGPRAP